MEKYEKMVVINQENWDKMSEREKEYVTQLGKYHAKQKCLLSVIYHPTCGCNLEMFVILDRYPMSEKIIAHKCQGCEKYCTLEISDPPLFHLPLTKQDFTLGDLRKFGSAPTWEPEQQPYIESYQFYSAMQFLDKKCEENS